MDYVILDSVLHKARIYTLDPGKLIVRYEVTAEGDHTLTSSKYSIFAYGASYDEAFSAFCEFFDRQYKDLVESSPDDLTLGALTVRALYENLVKNIDTNG